MRQLLAICYLLVWCTAACAVNVDHLDRANITVPDRSPAALSQGLKTAFSQVLIKLSGNPEIMTLPTIQNAAPDFQQWVQSYAYVADKKPAGKTTLQLQVQFDRDGLKQLLQEAGQAAWSANRPTTLIVMDDQTHQWPSMIKPLAKERGLPVMFPLMDLSDQSVINGATALSESQMQQLLARYGVSSLLFAHLIAGYADNWQVSGFYLLNGEVSQWQATASTKEALALKIVNRLTNMMTSQLIVSSPSAQQSTVTMNVVGVNNITDYTKVMRYLRLQPDVAKVAVKDIGPSGLLLSIALTGGVAHLQNLLAAGEHLKPINHALADNMHQADLYYYW